MSTRAWVLSFAALSLLIASAGPAAPDSDDKAALRPLQELIGSWKGVGQPQRGSTKGSWSETADWKWEFHDGHAALSSEAAQGKYFSTIKIRPAKNAGEYELTAASADGKAKDIYQGKKNADGKFVFDVAQPNAGQPARLTIGSGAEGARLTLLLEQAQGEGRFARLAEIGYTREGSGFGKGGGGPECVVTGGLGTLPVEYKGQTYYVCCTGCRDAFKAEPEKILAEYKTRKAAEKPKAGQ